MKEPTEALDYIEEQVASGYRFGKRSSHQGHRY